MMLLARCHAQAGRNAEAESWHMRACGEAPRLREPWLLIRSDPVEPSDHPADP